MLDYIRANCELPPLEDHPTYDKDSDMWELYFEELLPSWYVRSEGEHPELITLHFETEGEAVEILHQLPTIQNERIAYETTEQNQEPVLS
tara:strand:- start:445 stop:714 length:270 start_codon:yes stop_codon:yes gene_type:complete